MNKYDIYVYLYICEAALESFSSTKFVTFTSYCKSMSLSLKDNKLSKDEMRQIEFIWWFVDKIFGMSQDETARYVVEFFSLEDWLIRKFEKQVILNKRVLELSGNQ